MSKWSDAREYIKATLMCGCPIEKNPLACEYGDCDFGDFVKTAFEALGVAERAEKAEPKDIDTCEECELDFVKDCSEWCYPARRYRDGYQQALEDVRGKDND